MTLIDRSREVPHVDDEIENLGSPFPQEAIGRDLRRALHEEDLREEAVQERLADEARPYIPLRTRLRRFLRRDR